MPVILAAADTPASVLIAQWGAAGAVLVLFGVFGWYVYRKLEKRAEHAETLLQAAQDRSITSLTEIAVQSRDVLKEVAQYLQLVLERQRRAQ